MGAFAKVKVDVCAGMTHWDELQVLCCAAIPAYREWNGGTGEYALKGLRFTARAPIQAWLRRSIPTASRMGGNGWNG